MRARASVGAVGPDSHGSDSASGATDYEALQYAAQAERVPPGRRASRDD